MAGHFNIPDITGKADDVGFKGCYVTQDVVGILIDRIFSRIDGDASVGAGRRQAADGQGRLNKFRIQNGEQRFHERPSFNLDNTLSIY